MLRKRKNNYLSIAWPHHFLLLLLLIAVFYEKKKGKLLQYYFTYSYQYYYISSITLRQQIKMFNIGKQRPHVVPPPTTRLSVSFIFIKAFSIIVLIPNPLMGS